MNINSKTFSSSPIKTPKFSLGWLLTTNFFIYIALLVARSWGSHRMLHYEETIAVASALSQNLFASLNDFAYGTLVPRILIFVAVRLPLEYLPVTLLTIATVLWAIFSTIIFIAIYKKTGRYSTAFLASLVLILVPLPELGMQGIVWNSFWPMFIALGVVVACRLYGESKRTTFLVALFAFLTAASNPVAGVLMVLLGFDSVWHKALRNRAFLIGCGLFLGMLFSLYVQVNQEPPLRYLGEWTEEFAQTSETLGRLEDSGATKVRRAPSLDLVAQVKGFPGTIKYLLTQMSPEPYASRWILTESVTRNLIQVGFIFLVMGVTPLFVLFFNIQDIRNVSIIKIFCRLVLVLVSVVVLQSLLIGDVVQTRQFLFAPVCFYWTAVVLLVALKSSLGRKQRAVVNCVLLILLGVFLLQAKQNFRDPFDSNPRQGGSEGRYEDDPLWIAALTEARSDCLNMKPNDVVIISQKEKIWVDAPVVIRCKYIQQ